MAASIRAAGGPARFWHLGEPDHIGGACVSLASEESRFVTGSGPVVDGGYACRCFTRPVQARARAGVASRRTCTAPGPRARRRAGARP
ncbi:MAG: SDR family oxidoreductase [Burkholderiaceae bacterium]